MKWRLTTKTINMLNVLAFETIPDYLAKKGSDFSQYWAEFYSLADDFLRGNTEKLLIVEEEGAQDEADELSLRIMEMHMLFIYFFIMREEYDQEEITIKELWEEYEVQKIVDYFLSMNISIYQLLDIFELTTYELGIGTMKIGDNFHVL